MQYFLGVIVLIVIWGLLNSDISGATVGKPDQHHILSKESFLVTTKNAFERVVHNQLPIATSTDRPHPSLLNQQSSTEVVTSISTNSDITTSAHSRYAYVTLIHGIDEAFRYQRCTPLALMLI